MLCIYTNVYMYIHTYGLTNLPLFKHTYHYWYYVLGSSACGMIQNVSVIQGSRVFLLLESSVLCLTCLMSCYVTSPAH